MKRLAWKLAAGVTGLLHYVLHRAAECVRRIADRAEINWLLASIEAKQRARRAPKGLT